MISRFFIHRPIFAWVVAIVIMMAGLLSIANLPVAQYPQIALPQVSVNAFYPGASAKTVEDSVTQIIEQQMKGIDGLMYMNSTSDSSGAASINLTFKAGTDPDIAQVQVQNKLQSATPLLPAEVQQQGLTVAKASSGFLMVIGLYSDDPKVTDTDLGDYMSSTLIDQISRVDGVGTIQNFGAQYAMRIWLDPNKLTSYNLTPTDVMGAIRAQNTQVSAGQLGGLPAVQGTALNATITAQSRLTTIDQFRNIIVKNSAGGAIVRLQDVARLELGAQQYGGTAKFNGRPATGIAISLATGANALDTAKAVKAKMDELKKQFPKGYHYVVPFDTTPFIELSIEEVVKTLVEAVVLVFVVMFIFLQNWRATIIPTIAVPVVLLGTFGVLAAFGYSINTLTLFGLVLAIGLLVDDAIVVVENVERVMHEEKLPPLAATIKSMEEITGALIGIALVLSAVFIPMAFFGGSQGVIYRQFSITLVSAMALSVIVALVLTPALCATLLKPIDHNAKKKGPLGGFFNWFNKSFDGLANGYRNTVGKILGQSVRWMVVFAAIVALMAFLFTRLPTSFLPEEDQGILFTIVQLPPGATEERTNVVLDEIADHFKKDPAVESAFTVSGFSFSGPGQNAGMAFVRLKDFHDRKTADEKAPAVAGRAMGRFSQFRDAMAFAIVPPAVTELGNSSGFDLQLKDVGGLGHGALLNARNQVLGMASQNPSLMGVRPNGMEDTPELKLEIDQAAAGAMGVSLSDINATLSTAMGGAYVNDFIDRNRVKKVFVQADAPFRMKPEDLNQWYVRNDQGQMVPFSAFATSHWEYGSPRLERYNGSPSMNIQGMAAPGQSSGQAMAEMEKIIAQLPPGISYEWTGLSLQEKQSGAEAPMLYALSIFIVFILLAALYESWSIPVAIVMVIPLGVLGALLATMLRGLSNDIYLQVALLTIIGLSAKNAILIVEFAKHNHENGMSLIDATLTAARVRLRPIIMTSLAFTFGILPLFFANGAGSGSQNAIGTGLVGGILSATFLAVFFIPLFFVIIEKMFKADEKHLRKLAEQREAMAYLNRTDSDPKGH
ncbi:MULTISPECIES: efflux RND transporter permease subunit [Asticcacaulis]|uniref:efflux RND transporter permease subunit n=1 Tax=Asticcacaulis TaxID=76890 RepID=UPI001FD8C68D|nr:MULTISPECIES: efflux RND transporter permease subunit [Asticcacaulis]MBP2161123.1 multidrug efflux pump [Asticcacaulis solisilvae]MDR6802168.1 multidrug efflux pump [Asticcacaulis sp. BE141]